MALTILYPQTREFPKIILAPFGYLIILFSSLIYNEIIIFNFCNLNKDTKVFIEERSYEDSREISKSASNLRYGNFDTSDGDATSNEEDRNSSSS